MNFRIMFFLPSLTGQQSSIRRLVRDEITIASEVIRVTIRRGLEEGREWSLHVLCFVVYCFVGSLAWF